MSLQFKDLSVNQLMAMLKTLKGGSIGFDAHRDPRTSTKEKLKAYIVQEFSNAMIIQALDQLEKESEKNTSTPDYYGVVDHPRATDAPVIVRFTDINRVDHMIGFANNETATKFMMDHAFHHYRGRWTQTEWKASQESNFSDYKPTPIPQPTPASAIASQKATDKTARTSDTTPEAAQIAALLAQMAGKGAVDEQKVRDICDQRAQTYVDNILEATNKRLAAYDEQIKTLQMPQTVHVLKAGETKAVDLGHQHKNFPTLLKMAQARTKDGHKLNIWLKGPAGSGKTTAAKLVAKALEMPFQFNGAISTEYELMGFKDAAGNYHSTAFREIFENGGVYLFDEVDSSLPKAVLAFNAALANGECRFPDKMVERHKDCVIIAGANTAGSGANSDYVGRMKQDLAFLNRFVMLDWPLDEALEKALSSNKDWVRRVQKFRKEIKKRGIKGHIVSPRATFYGEALLAVGIDEETVGNAVLRGALTDEQWNEVQGSAELPF